MDRKVKQNECALCGSSDKLRKSHIIPKLVYKRMKSQSKSRFRELGNPNNIMNDGDKVHMLCSECELFMSQYETLFANKFIDNYLNGKKVECLNDKWLIDLISIINWRVVYDDLYLFDSLNYFEEFHKENLIQFELTLRNHLLALKKSDGEVTPKCVLNELCDLELLRFSDDAINYFKNFIFGYTFFDDITGFYTIISHFAGLVLITRYKVDNFMFINIDISKEDKKGQNQFNYYSIQKEIIRQYDSIIEMKKFNDEILKNGLEEKIRNYLGI